jgi:hypothetical protein
MTNCLAKGELQLDSKIMYAKNMVITNTLRSAQKIDIDHWLSLQPKDKKEIQKKKAHRLNFQDRLINIYE